MSLGFVILGMALGLVAGMAVWISGAGLFLGFLTYIAGGTIGTLLAAALAISGQPPEEDRAKEPVTAG